MKRYVVFESGNVYVVDDQVSLADIERSCPNFFKTPHGKRETYSMYRGFLIVRNTVTFGARAFYPGKPERRTTVYLCYLDDELPHRRFDTSCVSSGCELGSVRQAERLADKILETGRYKYGMEF